MVLNLLQDDALASVSCMLVGCGWYICHQACHNLGKIGAVAHNLEPRFGKFVMYLTYYIYLTHLPKN